MATSGAAAMFVAFLCLPHSVLGVSVLNSEAHLVRREQPKAAVELSPQGHAKKEGLDDHATSFCDFDFPLGQEGYSLCEFSNHSLILSPQMCLEAAREANAAADHAGFQIELNNGIGITGKEHHRPRGCYKYDCSDATETVSHNKVCYFYNGIGDWPQHLSDGNNPAGTVQGTPVCSRPKYLLGGRNSNGGCPDKYVLIQNENHCRNTAICLGDANGDDFRIGKHNASRHLDFSRDCFIDKAGKVGEGTNKVFYNSPSGITAAGWGTHPSGTPICQVENVVYWDDSGNEVNGRTARHHANDVGAANDTAAGILG